MAEYLEKQGNFGLNSGKKTRKIKPKNPKKLTEQGHFKPKIRAKN